MSGYMPHAVCYLWDLRLIVMHVIGDAMITLAYLCIPPLLIRARHGRQLGIHATSIRWFFYWFSAFIFLCGLTHANEILSIWYPMYWYVGIIKILTGAVSIGALWQLWTKLPLLSRVPTPDELAEKNRKLRMEVGILRSTVVAVATGAAVRRSELKRLMLMTERIMALTEEK